jgi:hypothetical protein
VSKSKHVKSNGKTKDRFADEDREIGKIHRVENPKKWKFDRNNIDKYYSEDYEDEIWEPR